MHLNMKVQLELYGVYSTNVKNISLFAAWKKSKLSNKFALRTAYRLVMQPPPSP